MQIDFPPNCGLAFGTGANLDKLVVDMTMMTGPGIAPWTNAWGCVGVQADLGCGLEFDGTDENAKIKVRPEDIAGAGLVPGAGCSIQVSTGCGLVFGTINELEVDLRGFDGPGLSPWQNAAGCWGLQVDCQWIKDNCDIGNIDPGCGLEIDPTTEQLQVKPDDLAGSGLVPSGTGCSIQVSTGCGIAFDATSGALVVSNGELAGTALKTEDECALGVDVPALAGCGLTANADKLDVDPAQIAGSGLVASGTGCSIQVSTGCGIAFDATSGALVVSNALNSERYSGLSLCSASNLTISFLRVCSKLAIATFDWCSRSLGRTDLMINQTAIPTPVATLAGPNTCLIQSSIGHLSSNEF